MIDPTKQIVDDIFKYCQWSAIGGCFFGVIVGYTAAFFQFSP